MKKQIISFTLLAVGFVAGASVLSALAAGTWTAPTATPPGANVDAPINVGNAANPVLQTRNAPLQISGNFGVLGGNFVYNPTASPIIPGSVLTAANDTGKVEWAPSDASGISQLCNSVTVPAASFGTPPLPIRASISLLINGKNICTDDTGCSYSVLAYNNTHPEGVQMYGGGTGAIYRLRQQASGDFIDFQSQTHGTNGDSSITKIIDNWRNGFTLMDDGPYTGVNELSKDAMTVENISPADSFITTICD